jgi:DNA-binding beta-propeller fold protein YncE
MNDRLFLRRSILVALISILAMAATFSAVAGSLDKSRANPGLFFVDYRHLNGGKDGVALLDLNPESKHFGKVLQRKAIGEGVLPHHLYFNNDESRLYTTALGGSMLYELILDKGRDGVPRITRVVPIETGGNRVGEDIYFTRDGSRFYMTFMGGQGGPKDGTVGVFDARTNELIETIQALPDDANPAKPFISHAHGISANEDLGILMVTNTINPADLASEVGNTVTAIDMATNDVRSTHLVADNPQDLSQPVEVLLTRDDLPPFALVTTINGGDIWVAPYDAETSAFGTFIKQVDGGAQGLGVALELYIHANHHGEKELYVSFGLPGIVNVYGLDQLPELPLKRTLHAGAGAHHMAFFETEGGRELVVVQNNLLNAPGLNAGTLQVIDTHTGELVGTVDLPAEYGLMPESIESALGHGADLHH